MFSKRKPIEGLSFISAEMVVSGDVTAAAVLHIDGRIDGHVRCDRLREGADGVVAGNIVAEEARIGGLVEGAVIAASVILEATARIRGDITYQTISIAAGAQVEGRLARRESLNVADEPGTALVATPIPSPKPRRAAKAAEPEDIFSLIPPRQTASG